MRWAVITSLILVLACDPPIREVPETVPDHPPPRSVEDVIEQFKGMTKVQQKQWNKTNEGKYWVVGNGKVEEVSESGLLSEMIGEYYIVTIKLESGDYVKLFYPKTNTWPLTFQKGQDCQFNDELKLIRDWGFWVTAYVKKY
jgi:hypothetical protein